MKRVLPPRACYFLCLFGTEKRKAYLMPKGKAFVSIPRRTGDDSGGLASAALSSGNNCNEAVTDYVRDGYNQAIIEKKHHIGFLIDFDAALSGFQYPGYSQQHWSVDLLRYKNQEKAAVGPPCAATIRTDETQELSERSCLSYTIYGMGQEHLG